MNLTVRHLLIAIALMFGQQAAQLHALSHLGYDIAVAERGKSGTPPIGHPAEKCIAFHAVDSVLPNTAVTLAAPQAVLPRTQHFKLSLLASRRIEFDSRAPPVLS